MATNSTSAPRPSDTYAENLPGSPSQDGQPIDFNGYLMVFVLDGPGIWRQDRLTPGDPSTDPYFACDGCSSDDQTRAFYRNVSPIDPFDPQLIMCQVCVQESWDRRLDPREAPDPNGARPHMYPPVKHVNNRR